MAGLWGAGDYTFVQARLGPLHLGCNREVAASSAQVAAYSGFTALLLLFCQNDHCNFNSTLLANPNLSNSYKSIIIIMIKIQ